jgi:hypothetical protein
VLQGSGRGLLAAPGKPLESYSQLVLHPSPVTGLRSRLRGSAVPCVLPGAKAVPFFAAQIRSSLCRLTAHAPAGPYLGLRRHAPFYELLLPLATKARTLVFLCARAVQCCLSLLCCRQVFLFPFLAAVSRALQVFAVTAGSELVRLRPTSLCFFYFGCVVEL